MIKKLPDAFSRKCERAAWNQMSRLCRARAMGATTLRANVINNLGEFCVATCLGTLACWRLYVMRKSGAFNPPPPPSPPAGAGEAGGALGAGENEGVGGGGDGRTAGGGGGGEAAGDVHSTRHILIF